MKRRRWVPGRGAVHCTHEGAGSAPVHLRRSLPKLDHRRTKPPVGDAEGPPRSATHRSPRPPAVNPAGFSPTRSGGECSASDPRVAIGRSHHEDVRRRAASRSVSVTCNDSLCRATHLWLPWSSTTSVTRTAAVRPPTVSAFVVRRRHRPGANPQRRQSRRTGSVRRRPLPLPRLVGSRYLLRFCSTGRRATCFGELRRRIVLRDLQFTAPGTTSRGPTAHIPLVEGLLQPIAPSALACWRGVGCPHQP
jgi:hypothetical protein